MTYKDLEEFLLSNNMSPMEFSKKTGISPQIFTNAKKRGGHFSGQTLAKIQNAITYKSPSGDNLFTLKQTFELQQLLSVPIQDSSNFSQEELDLIDKYRSVSDEVKNMIVQLLAYAVSKED